VYVDAKVGLRRVGTPGRLIIWRRSNRCCLNFKLRGSWPTYFLGRLAKLPLIIGEVLSLTHENFEEQISSSSLLSSLIIIYDYSYYSIYYNDVIFEEFGMKENREAAETLTTPYFKAITH
jgi:hypothetical protein